MIIRLDQSFIETLSPLGENFSGDNMQRLATIIDSRYGDIRSILKEQENKNIYFEPKVIELGKIGSRTFTLNPYQNKDSEIDDVPYEITQLLPTISPVRIDILAQLLTKSNNINSSYLKAGEIYDDGDVHSKYVEEVIEEEEGRRPSSPQKKWLPYRPFMYSFY